MSETEDNAFRPAILRIQELMRLGMWEHAESSCRELVQISPDQADAWFHLAFLLERRGALSEAEPVLREAVRIDDGRADCWTNLSVVLHKQGRDAEAEVCARRAVALEASNAAYWLNLGTALDGQQRWAEAVDAYRQSLGRDPLKASAWNNLALVEQKLGRLEAAQEAFERCLAIVPDDHDVSIHYAGVLISRGQAQQALELLQRLSSDNADACVALANWRHSRQELAEAEILYRKALNLAPKHFGARHNLATLMIAHWFLVDAETLSHELVADHPNHASAWTVRGTVLQMLAQSEEALVARRRAYSLDPRPDRHTRLLLGLQYAGDPTPAQLLEAHREWNAAHTRQFLPMESSRRSRSGKPLRLGFISQDFARHPIAFLALPAFEELAKLQCSVACYSDRPTEDEYTDRFRALSENWRKIADQTDEEIVEQIRQDEIDILVDLMGHTGNRLLVFARKPAPVQVTWLGYVGTTGLEAMDYLLADRFHVRPGEEEYYTERVLRMPNGYACYGPPEDAPEVGSLPAVRNATEGESRNATEGVPYSMGRVTFGCFNNPAKYAPSILDAWAEILRRVPASRLLLKYGGLDDPQVQERLRGEFTQRGVEGGRIVLEGWSPHRELLAAYNRVDLALDTQPYSGGLTTCEALWMGVPVITYPGQTFAGRHSVSHLTNAGYPQFIEADAEGYVDLAVQWAGRLDELAVIRAQMRQQVRSSPLCDAPRFAHDFLAVLRVAWEAQTLA